MEYKHLTKRIYFYIYILCILYDIYMHPLFFLIGGTLKVLEKTKKLKIVSDSDLK